MAIRGQGGGQAVQPPALEPEPTATAILDAELDLDNVIVDGGDYSGLVADGTIAGSIIRQVNLSGAKLGPLTLSNVALRHVELSNASLQRLVVRRTEWRTCRAIGLRLSIEHASDLSVDDCRLDYATIHLERVKGVAVFSGCTFKEATIGGDLSNTLFVDCDFVDTEFRATKATKCDLRASRLNSARGLLSLRGAMISPDQAVAISGLIASEAGLIVAS